MSQLTARLMRSWQESSAGRWYQAKERSEQKILAIVAAIVVFSLLWLLLWKPITDWRDVSDNRFQTAQTTLSWMQANEQRARASADVASPSGAERSLVPLLTRAAQSLDLKLNRLQPRSDGGVTVAIEGQTFDNVLAWIAGLQENNAISVTKVSINHKDEPGLVDAQIDLN